MATAPSVPASGRSILDDDGGGGGGGGGGGDDDDDAPNLKGRVGVINWVRKFATADFKSRFARDIAPTDLFPPEPTPFLLPPRARAKTRACGRRGVSRR